MAKPRIMNTVPSLLAWMEAAVDLVEDGMIDLAHVRRELKRFRKLCGIENDPSRRDKLLLPPTV